MIALKDIEVHVGGDKVDVSDFKLSSYPHNGAPSRLDLTCFLEVKARLKIHPGPFRRVGEPRSHEDIS